MDFTVTIDCHAQPFYGRHQDAAYNEVDYVGRIKVTGVGDLPVSTYYDGYVATVKGSAAYSTYILGDERPPFRRVVLIRFGFSDEAFWQFERRNGVPSEMSGLVKAVVAKVQEVAEAAGLFDHRLYVIFHEEPNPMKDGVVLHRPLPLIDIQVSTGAFAKLMVAFDAEDDGRRCFAHVSPREVSFVSQADLQRLDETPPAPEGRQIQLEDS